MLARLMTIGRNSLKRHNFFVMAEKVYLRVRERDQRAHEGAALAWCRRRAEPYERLLATLDPALWEETQEVCARLERAGQEKLARLGLDLGGGGNYHLLYFFTRYLDANAVVETGVAAGWSSQAILQALRDNGGRGHLYSSDFPYFRYDEPEKLIGYIVDDELKKNWSLFIEGDRYNLPQIAAMTGSVDLFHYDSDKSYRGRQFAIDAILPLLSSRAVVIFDDIQDNFHFRDFVRARRLEFKVFEFGGKYVGLTGGLGG